MFLLGSRSNSVLIHLFPVEDGTYILLTDVCTKLQVTTS